MDKLIDKIIKLKIDHYYCEDTWYSCPAHPEGCANDELEDGKCNCGANKYNALVDEIVQDVRRTFSNNEIACAITNLEDVLEIMQDDIHEFERERIDVKVSYVLTWLRQLL